MIREWPGMEQAQSLRLWATLVQIAEHVAQSEQLDALIVIGSLAKVQADEASDLDLLIAVAEGRFDEAWENRAELETPDVLVAWDFRPEPDKPIGTRKFLTRDIVKVELAMSDPAAAEAILAEPYYVIVGDDAVAERYAPMAPIPPEVLAEYAQKIRDGGHVPEVETRYSDLMQSIRGSQRSRPPPL